MIIWFICVIISVPSVFHIVLSVSDNSSLKANVIVDCNTHEIKFILSYLILSYLILSYKLIMVFQNAALKDNRILMATYVCLSYVSLSLQCITFLVVAVFALGMQ